MDLTDEEEGAEMLEEVAESEDEEDELHFFGCLLQNSESLCLFVFLEEMRI